MTITKMDLCSRVSKIVDQTTAVELKPIFETFLNEILSVLADGNRIEIRGFGCFKIKSRKKRIGRNPRTGETVNIPAYTAPIFKFSKDAQKVFDKKINKSKKKIKEQPQEPKETLASITGDTAKTISKAKTAPTPPPTPKQPQQQQQQKPPVSSEKSAEVFSPF